MARKVRVSNWPGAEAGRPDLAASFCACYGHAAESLDEGHLLGTAKQIGRAKVNPKHFHLRRRYNHLPPAKARRGTNSERHFGTFRKCYRVANQSCQECFNAYPL